MVPVCRALAGRHFQVSGGDVEPPFGARSSYYFSGKGFQKIGSLCLLLEESYGSNHSYTSACLDILVKGFRCLYVPLEPDCAGAPVGSYYESEWGGIASKEGFSDSGCRTADFGNACYNDHHFHFGPWVDSHSCPCRGYFVVAGAILLHLRPEMAADQGFVSYVETLIRDSEQQLDVCHSVGTPNPPYVVYGCVACGL